MEPNPETRPKVAYSVDGKVIHVDPTTISPDYLNGYLSDLLGSSESDFRISCISDNGTSEANKPELVTGEDPEGDALFLEHLVYDELCLGNYITVEKQEIKGQELMPIPET